MKRLGLIGGMSWESTAVYYRLLNQMTRTAFGGLRSADIILHSLEFEQIAQMQAAGDWGALTNLLVDAAQKLERAGAEALMICTNTMHLMATEVQAAVGIPLLHIADATAAEIKKHKCSRPLLLATKFTMDKDFYRGKLLDSHGISTSVPNEKQRDEVHRIIYEELCQGVITPNSKQTYLDIINECQNIDKIDGVILGCTEIGLLICEDDLELPVFDTTELHARMGIEFS
ncbi:MAG: aspartate/glutamate racemase family protein [Alphaproteobacteria bacterium]